MMTGLFRLREMNYIPMKGDSGGPLMKTQSGKVYQVGVTSASDRAGGDCGSKKAPYHQIWADVGYLRRWVEEVVQLHTD